MNEQLTHFDAAGNAVMVDVTHKRETAREAVAEGTIRVGPEAMRAILEGTAEKGDCWAWPGWRASWRPKRRRS